MINFADKVIAFNKKLRISTPLPPGISSMNPFKNKMAIKASTQFYQKFYSDNNERYFIAGINPGRFGAGITGIPFTDTKRLQSHCGISFTAIETHEPSSVFVYEVIDAFGGPEKFYSRFYINSICPLGFTVKTAKGKEINYNYYDNPELTISVYPFIVSTLRKQIALGLETSICFCLGTGKNFSFFQALTTKYGFFEKIIPLEHPRYVMQYKSNSKYIFIEKYQNSFKTIDCSHKIIYSNNSARHS